VTTSIYVFETGKKQVGDIYGCYIEEDGLERVKNQGRQDIKDKWIELENYWIDSIDAIKNLLKFKEYYSQKKDKEITNMEVIKNFLKRDFLDFLIFTIQETSSQHASNGLLLVYWLMILGFVFSSIYSIYLDVPIDKLVYTSIIIFLSIYFFRFKNLMIKYVFPFILMFHMFNIYTNCNFNKFFQVISPFNTTNSSSEILFFFNKVILGYLIYQFLLAVRKDTRK